MSIGLEITLIVLAPYVFAVWRMKARFFLCYHLFRKISNEVSGQLSQVPGCNISDLEAKARCEVLIHGISKLNMLVNRLLPEATLHFC